MISEFDLDEVLQGAVSIVKQVIQPNESISEYELLKLLQLEYPSFFEHLPNSDRLYEKHFWLFFVLYHFKYQLTQSDFTLSISTLDIRLTPVTTGTTDMGFTDPLADFYKDIQNLYLTESEIQAMQEEFWRRYLALDQKADAIKVLKLESVAPLTKQVLKKQYQKLAQKCHPDKGGSIQQFNEIKRAYEVLLKIVSNS